MRCRLPFILGIEIHKKQRVTTSIFLASPWTLSFILGFVGLFATYFWISKIPIARRGCNAAAASIWYTGNFVAGTVSFARKVSSEREYDFLRFYIDGVKRGEWSGEEDWGVVSFPLTSGVHTLEWSYEKDGSVSNGQDAAWVDSLVIPTNTGIVVFPLIGVAYRHWRRNDNQW
jgi:hypothetical protein